MAYLERVIEDHGDHAFLHISDEGTRLDISSLKSRYSPSVQLLACGPDRLTTALLQHLDNWPEGSVHYETFSALNALDMTHNEEFVVELQSTGQEVTVPKTMTLLEQLENHGHDVYADCREGLCGTCEVGVISGEVEHRDHVLSAREKKSNASITACVSRGKPCSKLCLDL